MDEFLVISFHFLLMFLITTRGNKVGANPSVLQGILYTPLPNQLARTHNRWITDSDGKLRQVDVAFNHR